MELAWLIRAQSKIGVHEVRNAENPDIIEFDSYTTLKATEDETPWCSSFVCWCLEKCGLKSTQSAWAQSYASYGVKLPGPKRGCIVVFRWDDGTGHVGFFDSLNSNGTLKILGGNQSDSVKYSDYKTDHVIAYRWPVPA